MPPDNQPLQNPLFNIPPKDKPAGVASSGPKQVDSSEAIELIRGKINSLYNNEPNAEEEAAETEVVPKRSKHQEFMHQLSISGKPLAEIHTAWHNYYVALPDDEKHQVWREFYANHDRLSKIARGGTAAKPHTSHHTAHPKPTQQHASPPKPASTFKPKSAAEIKDQLLGKISSRVTAKHKRNLKSLGFGLGMGLAVFVILMFGFFNERFVAPFITPSRSVSSTPIISDTTTAVGNDPKVIIPKINVEIPVIYGESSVDEAAVQRALESGVLHYPTTANPGELGNAVIFGHSSNNILNRGKYKFAFVLLNRLENGDTFMLERDGKRYVYKVFEKRVIEPTDFSVLNDRDRPTVTLITCDPPGSSLNRLIVVGEQISPDPSGNIASSANKTAGEPAVLPSNSQTLWNRFWSWISS